MTLSFSSQLGLVTKNRVSFRMRFDVVLPLRIKSLTSSDLAGYSRDSLDREGPVQVLDFSGETLV